MIWKVEFDDRARKELRKLDRQAQTNILSYLRDRIATHEDPRRFVEIPFERICPVFGNIE